MRLLFAFLSVFVFIAVVGVFFSILGLLLKLTFGLILVLVPILLLILLLLSIFDIKFNSSFENGRTIVKLNYHVINITLYDSEKCRYKMKKDGNIDYKPEKRWDLDEINAKSQDITGFYYDYQSEIVEILSSAISSVRINRCEVSILVGAEDAAATGLAVPIISSLISFLVGIIANYLELPKKFKLDVVPNFVEQVFQFNGNIVVSLRLLKFFKTGNLISKFWHKHHNELRWLSR